MNRSESIANLALSLSKLQGELQDVYKDKKGYNYTYADLSGVLQISRPLCAKYELAVTQLCTNNDVGIAIETLLMHSSGEWLSTTLVLPISIGKGMTHAQAVGSCITYGRRYALTALLGIAQTDDDASVDDTATAQVVNYAKKQTITPQQLDNLCEKITETSSDIAGICKFANVDALEKITPSQYENIIKMLNAKQKKNAQASAMQALVNDKDADNGIDEFMSDLGDVEPEKFDDIN